MTMQWFRFFIPERLAIDIENRKTLEFMNMKRPPGADKSINIPPKYDALKRKRRRMKIKAKEGNEGAIEKFCAQSSKHAKYAKSVIKKREMSELRPNEGNSNVDVASNAGGNVTVTSQNDNTNETKTII